MADDITLAPDFQQNYLLAALPTVEFEGLLPHLELIAFRAGAVLYERDEKAEYVYFPITSIISLNYQLIDGDCSEIACVGREGLIGIFLLFGGGSTHSRAVVQTAGYCCRIRYEIFLMVFRSSVSIQEPILRYAQALLTQVTQTAVCNQRHSLEQQICRWLLNMHDRLSSDQISTTQEWISIVLNVRRESVTCAAGKLQEVGYIRYRRGQITILNRSALQDVVCECYAVVKQEFDRLLPGAMKK